MSNAMKNELVMKKFVLFIVTVSYVMCHFTGQVRAQMDTIRGKAPYLHYNYYDSAWCQSRSMTYTWYNEPPRTVPYYIHACSKFHNSLGSTDQGVYYCFPDCRYMASEVAIRMEMDSAADISGLAFGYNTSHPDYDENTFPQSLSGGYVAVPHYNTIDYIFNIYDENMILIWSDTMATEDLHTDFYMEAGMAESMMSEATRQWSLTGEAGFVAPDYISMCKFMFDTVIHVPDTFFVGITSTTPIQPSNATVNSNAIIVTTLVGGFFSSRFNTHGLIAGTIPPEIRRYRISQNEGEQILNWADEECIIENQTCLYPILMVPCPDVTGLRYEPVGATRTMAFVQWDGNANHAAYEISYGPHGTPPGEGTMRQTTLPQAVLAQLDATTRYDVYVRARCDYDTTRWSSWSDTLHIHLATSAIEGAEVPDVTLAPNPTDGRLAVRCAVEITDVELYDMQGRTVLTAKAMGTETVLNLAALPKGVYIAVVKTRQGQAVRTVERR